MIFCCFFQKFGCTQSSGKCLWFGLPGLRQRQHLVPPQKLCTSQNSFQCEQTIFFRKFQQKSRPFPKLKFYLSNRIRKMKSLQSQSNTISQFRGHQRGKICVISRSWSLKKKRKKSRPGTSTLFIQSGFVSLPRFFKLKKNVKIFLRQNIKANYVL